nr:MAG: hypothetical protein 1 [Locarnavirus sp.]
MKATSIVIHANYFAQPCSVPFFPRTEVSPAFMQDLQHRTTLPWVVPFSLRAEKYKMLSEYHGKSRYSVSVNNTTLGCMTKAERLESGLSERALRKMKTKFELQSETMDPTAFLEKYTDPVIVNFVEDITLFCLQLLRAKNTTDRLIAITVFLKLRTGTSLMSSVASILSAVVEDIHGPTLQSADDVLERITDLRSLIANWEGIQTSAIAQKLCSVYKYAMALGVLSMVGIKIDEKAAYAAKRELQSPLIGVNFMSTILDTLALLVQRSLMYSKTGKWETFIHGPKAFGEWFDACAKVKRDYQFRGDLEAQDTNYPQFMSDIRQCVDDGKSILKFGDKASGVEMMAIKKGLNELLMMQADLTTYREAQKSRRPPFSLLVHGKTCVGKSTFTSMLFQYAGKVLNLPTEDEFRYTRNSCDNFWSGWNSMKWFLLLDDIAFAQPDSKIVDNSLNEVIQIMNDVPLVPDMAALEDKGRNPMRAQMCIATTNVKHLNAHAHFACPVAVQRRFPFVLTVSPKGKYARDDDPEMIDPSKLPPITTDWPDFWVINVERVVAVGGGMATYERVNEFTDVNTFLSWFATTIHQFRDIQARAGAGVAAMRDFKVCRVCHMIEHKCVCMLMEEPRMQAREYTLPQGIVMGQEFKRIEVENGNSWEYRYTPHVMGDCNYIAHTTIRDKDGMTIRAFSSPVCFTGTTPDSEPAVQCDDIAMAEILAEIVARQAQFHRSRTTRCVNWVVDKYLKVYMKSKLVRNFTHGVMEWKIARKVVFKGFQWYTTDNRDYYTWLGDMVSVSYMSRKWRYVLGGISAVSALVVTYGLYKSFEGPKPVVQGLRQSVVDTHFPKTERENVWKRDDYQTSSFDKTALNVSFADLPYDQLMQIVDRNTARIKVSNGIRAREGNTFSPCGHLWMTNNHTIFTEGDLEVTLSVTPHIQGASSNVTFKLRQSDIFRIPEYDLAFFEVFSWETKRDLRGLIRKPSLKGLYTASYVIKTKGIDTKVSTIRCAELRQVYVGELDRHLDTWTGVVSDPTVVGDCGSPLVSHKPVAAILGVHVMGRNNQVWAASIDSELVDRAVRHFGSPIVQCATPNISAPSRKKLLVELRQKSPLRWLEDGTVNCYGSFDGFTATSRSKVRPTLLSGKISRERQWELKFGAPELRDWRPWRLALLDSTKKKFGALSPGLMKDVARAYLDDVLSLLPAGALDTLEPLTNKATVNGIPGVRFIDKMNFKSSMGEPYNKSKKHFLSGVEGDMHFNDEVMERIAYIEECYSAGTRAAPVFSGQLKDEPRALDKIAAGKVRVFSAAPADWSFVVRKYMLPLIKLIQENPFIFEASPGCTVQSLEWQAYYKYLTAHGVDRLVAGDYGKFDKKMEALIILLAFWIMRGIYERAGWSADELLAFDCIAEDTAYAFTNFNGDLIAFMGSNPSGHPLTVIVNCIVNALYMRFAFVKLSPFEGTTYEKARRFKEFVNLITYGDDNAMGVSKSADWFNHTAIQEAMTSIGVEYTMADKESESLPFIHIRDVSYLKRTWRWDEDVGAIICPLEEESIRKMLLICNPSDTESPELHMASVMSSAINEWFWYGKQRFEDERSWIIALAAKNGLSLELAYKGAPTWEQLYDRFWKASEGITNAELGCESEHPRSVLPN